MSYQPPLIAPLRNRLNLYFLDVLSEKDFYKNTPLDPLDVGELLFRIFKVETSPKVKFTPGFDNCTAGFRLVYSRFG